MQWFRNLLFPFTIIYDIITRCRNWAFEHGWLHQQSFKTPIIAVGNLSTGGTGKTPMVEWLIEQSQPLNTAVLSRGYGRTTSGYILINNTHQASQVGDEPLQIKQKYTDSIISAVCENRVKGVQQLLQDHTPDLILLDDAYQHRYLKANHYILLTSYNQPYYNDYVLPTGNLRESRSGAARAHSIIITKCPPQITAQQREHIKTQINPLPHQRIYFATIAYDHILRNHQHQLPLDQLTDQNITVVTGIANPSPFIDHLSQYCRVQHLSYSDHYRFRESDINKIKQHNIIITTEKDYTKLSQWQLPNLYYLTMKMKFIGPSPSIQSMIDR